MATSTNSSTNQPNSIFPPSNYSSTTIPKSNIPIPISSNSLAELLLRKSTGNAAEILVHSHSPTRDTGNAAPSQQNTNSTTSNTPRQLNSQLNQNETLAQPNREPYSLLKILALRALQLTAPLGNFSTCNNDTDTVQLAFTPRNFIQLSGHPGSLARAGPNTLWKKFERTTHSSELCAYTYFESGKEPDLNLIVPRFLALTIYNGQEFLELEDLTCHFNQANLKLMDVKMGSRTFTESEVGNEKRRTDLFEKMLKIDPTAGTEIDRETKSMTKLNYMKWRESTSTTMELSFRIEGVAGTRNYINCKKLVRRCQVVQVLREFLSDDLTNDTTDSCSNSSINVAITCTLINRLKDIKNILENSSFFQGHEVIGSSLLILRDNTSASAYLIDFAKTIQLPDSIKINHRSEWVLGNREDGYLTGLENLINILEEIL